MLSPIVVIGGKLIIGNYRRFTDVERNLTDEFSIEVEGDFALKDDDCYEQKQPLLTHGTDDIFKMMFFYQEWK